ncbi:MAG: hypothetical protein Q9218_004173 [Villophora microphyllina]
MVSVRQSLWMAIFMITSINAAPNPVVVAPIESEGPIAGSGGANASAITVPAEPSLATSSITSATSPPTTSSPTVNTSPQRKSYALTPHSENSVTGDLMSLLAGQKPASTPLAAQPKGGAGDVSSYFASYNAGLSTIPGCFHTQTELINNQYTTTATIPCVANAPQYSSNVVWQGSTNPNPLSGGPVSEIPHPETTVAGDDPKSILAPAPDPDPIGGHGPLPKPETTVSGGNMGSILGGPGQDPATTVAPHGIKTTGEPGPISAAPAPSPAPAPLPTTPAAPVPSALPQSVLQVPKSSPVITIGSSTITADSSSHFVIGSQTLAPGGSAITHSGTVLSIPPSGSGVVIGPSTQSIQPANPTPVITVGSSTLTADSSSYFVLGSQTLAPGGSAITHSGTVISLAPSASALVVAGQTQALTPALATPLPSITAGGQVVTENSASQFVIGGQTLKQGAAPIVANGQTVSLAPGGSAIILNGQTAQIAQPSPRLLPVITVGGAKITGNSASQYIINGQTLAAGQAPITLSGQVLSIAAGGSAVVFGPSTQAFVTPPMVLSTSPPLITVGASRISANAASDYVIAGQTLHPGGSAITLSGTVISLAPSATALVIGGSTEALTPSSMLATTVAPLITLGSQVLHANADSAYVIDGQTLTPGYAITVSGTVISLAPGASDVVVGGSTEMLAPQTVSLSTGMPVLTIGSKAITANAEGRPSFQGRML